MKRYTLACMCLIASAFVLTGMIVVQLSNRLPQAQAGLVIKSGGLNMLTAKTAQDQESVFIIDSANNALLIYQTEAGQGDLQLLHTEDLGRLFNLQAQNATSTGPSRRSR